MQAYKILHRLGTIEMYHSVRIFSPVVGADRVKFLKHQTLIPQKATPETVWWIALKEKTRNTSYNFKQATLWKSLLKNSYIFLISIIGIK